MDLLLWAHVVEGCQIDYIPDFKVANKWINEPARRNASAQLKRFCFTLTLSSVSRREGKNLSFLTRGILCFHYSELCGTDIAVGVLDVFTYVVVHFLSHLGCIVDLIFEYLKHI